MRKKIALLASIMTILVLANAEVERETNEGDLNQWEMKLTRTMDKLNEEETIDIYGDMISLEKIPMEEPANVANAEQDPLLSRIDKFLRSRTFRIRLPNNGSVVELLGRSIAGQDVVDVKLGGLTHGASEARTKLKKIILPILLALKLKALIVLPIVITLIGIIGIKGLGAGLAALLLSGAVALKALLTPSASPPPRISYGIVKPHDIHHDHWHRSQEEINQPYYGSWSPEYNVDRFQYPEIP